VKRTKKNIIILCCSLVMILIVSFSTRFLKYIDISALKITVLIILNLLNGFIAWLAMKQTDMIVDMDFKNKRQYLIGAIIALALSVIIAVIPALCGFSLVGKHTNFSWFDLIYNFLFYMLIIGPVEEFVFRVYLQDTFVSFFEKHKWLGVVVAAFLFGLWHIINGNIVQVLFAWYRSCFWIRKI